MELPSQIDQIGTMAERWLFAWTQGRRLHMLSTPEGAPSHAVAGVRVSDLLLERFELHEAVSEPFCLTLQVMLLDAHVPLKQLCGQAITLRTQLADGSHVLRSGIVTQARALQADGGFARQQLTVRPWVALLAHTLHSRIWQERSVIEVIDDVLAQHPDLAVWRWDEGVADHVAQGLLGRHAGRRPHCVQHRESDLDFIQRLLAEEGIAWRVEARADAPAGHGLVFFVHSAAQPQDPTSAAGALAGPGIRFHASPGHDSQESQDTFCALGHERRLGPTTHAVLGWDPMAHAAVAAELPCQPDWGPCGNGNGTGDDAGAAQLTPWLADYDPTCGDLFTTPQEAGFAATLLQQAAQARTQRWQGRGNVRTLRAGTWVAVSSAEGTPELFITRVHAVGENKLPKADPTEAVVPPSPEHASELHTLAARVGHACAFEAVPRTLPWRAALDDGTGLRLRPRPTARGPQTAIVVGPQGQVTPQGADVIHTDAMGRIRVRFHWQADADAVVRGGAASSAAAQATSADTCWLRVQQRLAGPAMGHQFIPRIGQEVLVGFLCNDIDRPVVIASLYNGQGESGIAPTPGGAAPGATASPAAGGASEPQPQPQPKSQPVSAFAHSTDHTPASQMNLVGDGAGGHSPAWHGGAPGAATDGQPGQANAAALSGIKSQEFGGSGHNQLVLDDTPQQLRTRLHTTQAQTWLEMGHLLHQADNHRGSLRGQGLELRTDAWGGLRAARGLLLSTYGLRAASGAGLGTTAEPAGDNAAGIALARQLQQLAQAFHGAASTHQTVGLTNGVQACTELALSLRGSVSERSLSDAVRDAQARQTAAQSASGEATVPHTTEPHIALTGKAGVGLTAGAAVHLSSEGTTTLASGQDSHWAVGGQARIHTAQAIGVLAGTVQPGSAAAAGRGLSLIAAQGDINLQAQNGSAQVMSQQALTLQTAQGAVNIAAAKRVVLAVTGGASITLEGGQLTVQCPGKLTVRAGAKRMVGAGSLEVALPILPSPSQASGLGYDQFFVLRWANSGKPMADQPFRIRRANGQVQTGSTDAQGRSPLLETASTSERLSIEVLRSQLKA